MINYHKNELINECLARYYETFAHTLDTVDYVPQKFNDKILAYIFKNMRRQFKKIDRADRRYQKQVAKQQKENTKRGKNNVRKKEQTAEENGKNPKKCTT